MNGDRDKAKKRLARDMEDLADAKESKAESIRALAEKLENDEITVEELIEGCRERQILLEVPF